MPSDHRQLCVSLHDVAPATLGDCEATLGFLDEMGVGPVALLVVPDYHGLGRMDRDERFCRFLQARERRGDEIVLHGYLHLDAAPPAAGLRDWLDRRLRTAGEGEFARLDGISARARLLRGLAVLRSAGWQPSGFVPPAWLMSPGTLEALDHVPLRYYATRDAVVPLPTGEPIPAPSLVMSTRSRWRRALCPAWNRLRLDSRRSAPLLRAAFHPRDLSYPDIAALWRDLLGQLSGREIRTEGQIVAVHS